MTELEEVIVEPLVTSGKIKFYKFYIRYVDGTLLLAKEKDTMFKRKGHYIYL